MKLIRIVVISVAVLTLIAFGVFQYFFRSAVPVYSGTEILEGLHEPVEVRTDEHGIPHIFAQNEADLYFAQGYIIARERLFQMDMTRLAGRGELSTYFGDVTVDKDRFLKTVGFYRQSQKSYEFLQPETKAALNSFAAGVNTYIKTTRHLPREYFFLGVKPELWEPADSIVVVMLMSYSLTRSKKIDLILHKVREDAGEDILRQIIPSYPDFAPVLVSEPRSAGGPNQTSFPSLAAKTAPVIGFEDRFPFPREIAASNWMLFSGNQTESGKALFAGSPDLAPTLPALFYVMHLKAGEIDAMGGVLPGVPSLGPLGYNGHFAFSAVNGRGDEVDYFIEKINPDNPGQYLTEDGYQDFQLIEDEIRIKTDDGFRSEKLTIRITRHGPIISETLPGAPENCAMQWSALDLPNRDIDGLLKLVKAQNFDEFRAALSHVRTVNLNIGYADKEGNIGWQFTAAPPVRKKGDGSLPVPGWNGEYDWLGFVPFAELPYDYNPSRGYVASFNNEPGNVSYHLTNYYLFERAIRFQQIMETRPQQGVTFAELKRMQLDTKSVVAERWVPLVLEVCREDSSLKPCLDLFRNWDFKIEKSSSAATLFNYFYYLLMGNTLKDEVGEELWEKEIGREYIYYVPDLVMTRIINDADHPLFDDSSTETVRENRSDIIKKSMVEAIRYLSETLGKETGDWKWGEAHKMAFDHPLGSKLFFLNLDPIPTHGSHHTINSGFWDSAKPFNMSSGGVIRMMVDFSDPERSTIISPPGQSGHYMSPFYDDQAEAWAEGEQIPMNYQSGKDLPTVLMLTPAP